MIQQELTVICENATSAEVLDVGGKGLKLLDLKQNGYRVPSFFIVPADVCTSFLDGNPKISSLLERLAITDHEDSEFNQIASQVRDTIVSLELPEQLIRREKRCLVIHQVFKQVFNENAFIRNCFQGSARHRLSAWKLIHFQNSSAVFKNCSLFQYSTAKASV